MASLEKRNGIYRISLRLDGRRHRRSLETGDNRAAQAHLAVLEDTLHRVKLGTIKMPEEADPISFLLSGGQSTKKPCRSGQSLATIGNLLDQATESLSTGSLEQSTVTGMKIHIRHLRKNLRKSTPLSELGSKELQEYVNLRSKQKGRRGRKVQPATIKKELATFRGEWNRAHRAGVIPKSFPQTRDLRFPKAVEKPPFQTRGEIERKIASGSLSEAAQQDLWDCVYLTPPDLDDLLQYVENATRHSFIYPMFLFAAHTGARRSEIIRSQIEDVDFDTGLITIREKKRVRGKLTTRTVPFSPRLRSVLSEWLNRHPGGLHTFCPEFESVHSRKRLNASPLLTPDSARFYFKKTLNNSKWAKLKGWHVFRHSFCSISAASGVDQRTINGWVGHQTEDMVRRYRHLIPSSQHEDIRRVFGDE